MIVYKNILEKLKAAGYSTYRIKKENILSGSTVDKIRAGQMINLETLDRICQLTGLPVEELIEYRP